jgi:tryptophanyl-tRNA synthetase
MEELQRDGADLDADVPFQLLKVFLEDDAALESIGADYKVGRISSAAVKDAAATCVWGILRDYQERRAAVTDADVEHFCRERDIFFGPKN